MSNRLKFRLLLKTATDIPNLYFQPPESVKIKYPCCIYSLLDVDNRSANNRPYSISPMYEVILIDPNPDSEYVYKLHEMPQGRFIRFYTSNNLNHWVYRFYLNGTFPKTIS